MSSQTSGPLTRAAAAGCAKTWSLTVMTALAVTPAARCEPDARMRGEEDSRCFQISRIALETVSRFRRKRKDEESKQLGGLIGIGGRLATPPLPHHRAYGSVPRRFDRVRLGRAHRFGEDRATRNSRCVGPVGPPDVRTCARAQLVNQLRPPPGTLLRRDGATPRSGFAWFAIAAKDTNAIFDGSTLRGS